MRNETFHFILLCFYVSLVSALAVYLEWHYGFIGF
jgi:hypothetical protein